MQDLIDIAAQIEASLSVEFNEHKNLYEIPELFYGREKWMNLEGVDFSKDIWQIRIYVRTPIVFHHFIGNDLNELIKEAKAALNIS